MPDGCHVNDFSLKDGENVELHKTNSVYECHVETNATINRNSASLKNCNIYVSLFSCNHCAKMIIQSGIKKVDNNFGKINVRKIQEIYF